MNTPSLPRLIAACQTNTSVSYVCQFTPDDLVPLYAVAPTKPYDMRRNQLKLSMVSLGAEAATDDSHSGLEAEGHPGRG